MGELGGIAIVVSVTHGLPWANGQCVCVCVCVNLNTNVGELGGIAIVVSVTHGLPWANGQCVCVCVCVCVCFGNTWATMGYHGQMGNVCVCVCVCVYVCVCVCVWDGQSEEARGGHEHLETIP